MRHPEITEIFCPPPLCVINFIMKMVISVMTKNDAGIPLNANP